MNMNIKAHRKLKKLSTYCLMLIVNFLVEMGILNVPFVILL